MKALRYNYPLLCILAVLAGCGAPVPPAAGFTSVEQSGQSLMSPEAKGENLLYVSYPSAGTVAVYTYPGAKLVGTLKGFSSPNALCTDKSGDIWISNGGGSTMVEYAHGGSQPITTLKVKGRPGDCSVDPASGDLAVSSWSTGEDSFFIYPHAQEPPVKYHVPFEPDGVAYDDHGNLFVDGRSGLLALGELPRGKRKMITFSVPPYDYFGQVRWDGKYVDVSAYEFILRFSIQGKTAVVAQKVILDVGKYVGGYCIKGSHIVATNWFGSRSYGLVASFFKFPAGGRPTKTISGQAGWGVAISMAPSTSHRRNRSDR